MIVIAPDRNPPVMATVPRDVLVRAGFVEAELDDVEAKGLTLEEAVTRGLVNLPPNVPRELLPSYLRSLRMHVDIGADPLDPSLDETLCEGSADEVLRFLDENPCGS